MEGLFDLIGLYKSQMVREHSDNVDDNGAKGMDDAG